MYDLSALLEKDFALPSPPPSHELPPGTTGGPCELQQSSRRVNEASGTSRLPSPPITQTGQYLCLPDIPLPPVQSNIVDPNVHREDYEDPQIDDPGAPSRTGNGTGQQLAFPRTGRVRKTRKGQTIHERYRYWEPYTRREHLRPHQQEHNPAAPCHVVPIDDPAITYGRSRFEWSHPFEQYNQQSDFPSLTDTVPEHPIESWGSDWMENSVAAFASELVSPAAP